MKRNLFIIFGILYTTILNAAVSPNGIEYVTEYDGVYYASVKGGLSVVDADYKDDLYIADEVDGLPVVEIATGAFMNRIDIERVILGKNIVSIGSDAFKNVSSITELDLSRISNALNVGSSAFYNTGISGELIIPDASRIGMHAFASTEIARVIYTGKVVDLGAFHDCPELTEIQFSEGMTDVRGFANCPKITSVTIPASVTTLGVWASDEGLFKNCTALTEVIFLPDSKLTTVYENVFLNTGLRVLKLPETVSLMQSIGEQVFDEGWVPPLISNTTVPFQARKVHYYSEDQFWKIRPTSLPFIYSQGKGYPQYASVYINDVQLTELTAPLNTDIYIECLTGIKKISAPNNTKTNSVSIRYMEGLEEISIGAGSTYLRSISENPDLRVITISPKNKLVTYASDGVFDISFAECSSLESISLPGIKKFKGSFEDCTSLRSIVMPDLTECGASFRNCKSLETVSFPSLTSLTISNKNYMRAYFSGCSSLKEIDFPLVQEIPGECFKDCAALETVKLPMVYTVGYSAFSGCTSLKAFPFSLLKVVENNAFLNCSSLEEANMLGLFNDGRSSAPNCFQGCTSLTHLILNGAFRATTMGAPALELIEVMEDVESASFRLGLKTGHAEIIFNGNIGTLEYEAFRDCKALERVVFKGKIQKIGKNIFYGASNLKTVDIADPEGWLTAEGEDGFSDYELPFWDLYVNGVPTEELCFRNLDKDVRNSAFAYCNLKKIDLGVKDGCELNLGDYSFYNCRNLSEVNLGEGFVRIGQKAFTHSAMVSFKMPESVKTCGLSPLDANTLLESVVISPNLESIPHGFLYGCTSLKSLIVPEGVKNIGHSVVTSANNLEYISLPSSCVSLSTYSSFGKGTGSFPLLNTSVEIYIHSQTAPKTLYDRFVQNVVHVPVGRKSEYESLGSWALCDIVEDIPQPMDLSLSESGMVIYPHPVAQDKEEMQISHYKVTVREKETEEIVGEYKFDADGNFLDDTEEEAPETRVMYSASQSEVSLKVPLPANFSDYIVNVVGITKDGHHVMNYDQNITVDEVTTTIDSVYMESDKADVYYNLQGIRVNRPTRPGFYIINGHKEFVK